MNLSLSTFANLRRRKNISKAELPQTSFFLRLMEERDLPFVMTIERLSFSHPWLESTFKGEINNRGISFPFVVVHRHQGKIIGYIIFWLMGEKAQISNFAIHPDFRRMGVRLAEKFWNPDEIEARRSGRSKIPVPNFDAKDGIPSVTQICEWMIEELEEIYRQPN